jgi:hypothetical protein
MRSLLTDPSECDPRDAYAHKLDNSGHRYWSQVSAFSFALEEFEFASVVATMPRCRVTSSELGNATLFPRCGSYPWVLVTQRRRLPE